jgi:Pvc16 N-terminal domain
MLTPAVGQAVGNAKVGFGRPDSSNQTPLVNVYLYQVTPNGAYRNTDLPTRSADGTLGRRPQAALDLHYLFTFHGNDDQLEPQRLLGAVATTLHAQPVLSRQDIIGALNQYGFLATSNLADQVDRVRFTPTSLSLEEFSKLWSAFFQVEYSLSAVYQASVVLLESDQSPQGAPPVLGRNLYVAPFRSPTIDRVISQTGADQPILAGGTLLIEGRALQNDSTLVLLEGQELTPSAVTDNQVTLPLPASMHAGLKGLQIVQKQAMGTPPTAHRGPESNVAPFVLRPSITGSSAVAAPNPPGGTNVTLSLAPNIGVGQRAVLLLNNPSAVPPTGYASSPTVSTADAAQVVINIRGVPAGQYLARVQIDGAESLLTVTGNVFTGPVVVMP